MTKSIWNPVYFVEVIAIEMEHAQFSHIRQWIFQDFFEEFFERDVCSIDVEFFEFWKSIKLSNKFTSHTGVAQVQMIQFPFHFFFEFLNDSRVNRTASN